MKNNKRHKIQKIFKKFTLHITLTLHIDNGQIIKNK